MKCLKILIAMLVVLQLVSSCKSTDRDVAQVIRDEDSTQVDYVGEEFIDAFRAHVIKNYEGKNILDAVREKPFLHFNRLYETVFKMDIDTMITFNDTMVAVRFHGALDSLILFSCHICSAPQALGVFTKKGDSYYLNELADVSKQFHCPYGGSTKLELHFDKSAWPGPMLFSWHINGWQGNFYEYVEGVDLSRYSVGNTRFSFSNSIRKESTFFPNIEGYVEAGFPSELVPKGWRESYIIFERGLSYFFDEEARSFEIRRSSNSHWEVWYGEENMVVLPTHARKEDTLRYSIEGGFFSPK